MPTAISRTQSVKNNPMEMVEQLVLEHEWPFDKRGDDDLTVGIGGNLCEFQLWFSWRAEIGALHFSCAFDLKTPKSRRRDIHTLLAMLNEKLAIGHFDLWPEDGVVMFRHALLLRGGASVTTELIEDLVQIALGECERCYPAFQFLLWGGKSPPACWRRSEKPRA